jgi:hypothetical protein
LCSSHVRQVTDFYETLSDPRIWKSRYTIIESGLLAQLNVILEGNEPGAAFVLFAAPESVQLRDMGIARPQEGVSETPFLEPNMTTLCL